MHWHTVRQQLCGDMNCSPLTLMERDQVELGALVVACLWDITSLIEVLQLSLPLWTLTLFI